MIPASADYLRLLFTILEETSTVLDDAINEMRGCDYRTIDLDPENIAMLQDSHFNLIAQIQNQLRECSLKSYSALLSDAVNTAISYQNEES